MMQSLRAIPATILPKNTINIRLAIVCLASASMGLSMALISIAKLLLVLFGFAALLFLRRAPATDKPLAGLYTPIAVLTVLFAFAVSMLWTVAPPADAWGSIAKYGKLILIVLMMLLIHDRREAMYALGWFLLAQVFLLASSWMLFFHLPVPWATSNMALKEYAVFSSYLDQGIMAAVLGAVCWHLRELAPGRFGRHVAVFIAVAASLNVLFVLGGRSGHVVAIALLSLAIMWQLPRKYRAGIVLLPFVLVLLLFFSSTKVRERLTTVKTEVESYVAQPQIRTSSGIRLGLWVSAAQIIGEHPVAGAGIGSWSTEYNRIQREKNPAHQDIPGNGNPHQEYLQWGVQLGIPGLLLLAGLMLSVLRDSLKMEPPYARAAQSALAALAVACLFNSIIYDALIGDFFCLLIGLLLALGLSKATGPVIAAPQRELTT